MGMVIIVLQNINMVDYIYNSDLSFLVSNFRRTIYPSNYAQYANYLRYQLKTLDNVEYILKTDSIRKKTYEKFI